MRIRPDYLLNDLKKEIRGVYLLTGDEPLQLIEAADNIRREAKGQGFTEREVFHVDRSFDWGSLLQAANSLSLFAEKKILDVRLSSVKLGDVGSKTLLEYCLRPSPDNILMLSMPKLDKRSQNLKWFKALEQIGAVIQIWPVDASLLPQWIHRRMQSKGLTISKDAAGLLAEKVEGNLLAAAQEIEKLSLRAPITISAEDILESASDDAKYDVFKLVDAAVAGKYRRVAKIIHGLKATGEAPSVVLWAFTREIRMLMTVSHETRQGTPISQSLRNNQVWDQRVAIVKSALGRFSSDQYLALLSRAIKVDQVIKGVSKGSEWDELLDLGFSIAGKNLFADIQGTI